MRILSILGLLALFFIAGCGTAAERSEFWKHKTHFQNFDHAAYSLWGYEKPTNKDFKESKDQHWWGIPTPK